MGRFLKKHRDLLVTALLLVAPLVVYASHAGRPEVPGPLRHAVLTITAPAEWAVVGAVHAAEDAWYGYLDLRRVRRENLALREENLRLQAETSKLAEVVAENDRLRKLVAYGQTAPELQLVTAPVIGYGPDPSVRIVRLGRGSTDGLRSGMPVVTPDGVVGRLTEVEEHTADVLLITDPSSAVAALSQRTRARATVRGLASSDRLKLDYLLKGDDLEESDILVTAPSGGLFPKGLRLGRATRVRQNPGELFKRAEIVPFVDFRKLEEVQVVVDQGPTAEVDRPLSAVAQ